MGGGRGAHAKPGQRGMQTRLSLRVRRNIQKETAKIKAKTRFTTRPPTPKAQSMLRAYNPPEPAPPNPNEFQVPESELKKAVERSEKYKPVLAAAVKLESFNTNDGRGVGVRCAEPIKAGQFVCEYAGKNVTEKEGKQRELKYLAKEAEHWYFYYYQAAHRRMCVDAMDAKKGTFGPPGLGRLINHSRSKPNLCTRMLVAKETPRLFLFALRDIKKGEELLFDYGDRDEKSTRINPWLLA